VNLNNRLKQLEAQISERPRPTVMPDANAEEIAIAILTRQIEHDDLDESDPRRVEAVTMLIACLNVAEAYRDDRDKIRIPVSCPLTTACERALADPAPTVLND
jgi:hypothetical protein